MKIQTKNKDFLLETVTQFKYLRVILTVKSEVETEINRSIPKAAAQYK